MHKHLHFLLENSQKESLVLWGSGTIHTHLLVASDHSTPCFFQSTTTPLTGQIANCESVVNVMPQYIMNVKCF